MERQTQKKPMDEETKRKTVQMITVAATLLLLFMIVGLIINIVSMVQLSNYRQDLNDKLKALMGENTNAELEIEYRYRDDYVERYAREQLGMRQSDEYVYIIAEK